MAITPKAGDGLILPDGKTIAVIKEVSEDHISLSRFVEAIPIEYVVPVPDGDYWQLTARPSK